MNDREIAERIASIERRVRELDDERTLLAAQLAELQRQDARHVSNPAGGPAPITARSTSAEKIAIFRQLFAGRLDVFAVRWENAKSGRSGYAPACANEWIPQVCRKPQIKCGACLNQAFIPVSDEAIGKHLRGSDVVRNGNGDFVIGVYPLFDNETCRFLAADFDGPDWSTDALAFLETCRSRNIPAALERSRSGEGGHVWIFFTENVAARDARQLGAALLTETMERRPEIGFTSYDRFFPNQDTMPAGGFGNLIALPLQRRARERGNALFVDDALEPHRDQWAFLSSLRRLEPSGVAAYVREAEARDLVTGVRMPVEDDEADQPWLLSPSRRPSPLILDAPLPASVKITLADDLYIDRSDLPAPIVTRLVRIAAFQNPEFYRAQAMRMPTFEKPRIISCAELHRQHVALPRGCLDEALALFGSLGIATEVVDLRERGRPLNITFEGTLRKQQVAAVRALEPHDTGVLAATTAFGKTVVAAALIAKRARSTLILVHRRELLAQWVERLCAFLSVDRKDIGAIAGGRRKPSGRIDVAVIQSLVHGGEVSDAISGYGQLIIDECHHLSARSFELVARRSKAQYVLGLSATVTRKDGHHPIIFMQCGPVRHRVDPKTQAAQRGFEHIVYVREVPPTLWPAGDGSSRPSIASIYADLARDEVRNQYILDDVAHALKIGRVPLVLTERREHLDFLRARFAELTPNVIALHGGMNAADRRAMAALRAGDGGQRIFLATGRYLGEGFDDASLDTLFLTMPISWKGTLAQYVGRLHREHHGKTEVVVFDYVDRDIPMLARMAEKRIVGYRSLGYVMRQS